MILKAIKRFFEPPGQTMSPLDEKFVEKEKQLAEAHKHMLEAARRTEKASEILRDLIKGP